MNQVHYQLKKIHQTKSSIKRLFITLHYKKLKKNKFQFFLRLSLKFDFRPSKVLSCPCHYYISPTPIIHHHHQLSLSSTTIILLSIVTINLNCHMLSTLATTHNTTISITITNCHIIFLKIFDCIFSKINLVFIIFIFINPKITSSFYLYTFRQ